MAWSFTNLRYGWKIAAGITLAAITIFIADNTRERVNQADVIELVLGVTERCLATQYATNPVSYYVAPPSFVRSWYSNSYETTNVPGDLVTNWYAVLHTNAFTNVIGWRTDRAMMAELDEKIKALVPYYCDTNTVYDGSTNIVMLTVTGLWASLGIGDGTNQFTSVPASGTNAATYGALPWRIYKKDLEERYKVLNALKITAEYYDATVCGRLFGKTYATSDWEAAKSLAESEFLLEPVYSNYADWLSYTAGKTGDNVCIIQISSMYYPENAINTGELCSAINRDVYFYIQPDKNVYLTNMGYASVFNANGLDIEEDVFKIITNYPFGTNPDSVPEWCTPTASGVILGYAEGWSFGYVDRKQLRVADWDFQYCTNKYW